MKAKQIFCTAAVCSTLLFTACGSQQVTTEDLSTFRTTVDNFCISIESIDEGLNSVDTSSSDYPEFMMENLNTLDANFKTFADIDFPKDYDYLEGLADEASEYMTTAVGTYKDIFENNYSEDAIDEKYAYAKENYSRAYKRIQIIITFLNGETSSDAIITES